MSTHDTVWRDLPWFVNGTLPAEARAQVEAHIAHCPACRAELALQRRVAQELQREAPADLAEQAGWSAIETRLRRPTPIRPWRWLTQAATPLRLAALGAPAAAAVAVALVMIAPEPPREGFVTLTETPDATGGAGVLVRVRPAIGISRDAVVALLQGEGLMLQPHDDTAVIHALAPADVDAAALARRLTADPRIALAAADTP